MARIVLQDAFGKDVVVDDEISLLGPHVDLTGTSAALNSRRDLNHQPIRFHRDRPAIRQRVPSGYVGSAVDDPEYLRKHWGVV
jgi:hypothetical protein